MHDEFYKIVSQIIPVLFLGLTLQSIFLLKKQVYLAEGGDHFRRNVHVMTFCGIVFSLFLGEIIALKKELV